MSAIIKWAELIQIRNIPDNQKYVDKTIIMCRLFNIHVANCVDKISEKYLHIFSYRRWILSIWPLHITHCSSFSLQVTIRKEEQATIVNDKY